MSKDTTDVELAGAGTKEQRKKTPSAGAGAKLTLATITAYMNMICRGVLPKAK